MTAARRDGLVALGVALLTAVVFHCAPPAKFLQWDDARTLLTDDRWRRLDWESLKWMAASRHYGPWQPLSWFSWFVDHALFGLDPAAFRRTNILLHSLTAGMSYLVCRRIVVSPFGAAAAALFFAIHPLRVESVVWITERRDVLSGLFVVASVWAWLDRRPRLSALVFLLAALSKGTAVAVLPFLFFLGANIRSLWAHIAIASFAAIMNMIVMRTGDIQSFDLSFFQRMVLLSRATFIYPWKTFIPFGLSPYYALPKDFSSLYPAAIAGMILSVIAIRSKPRPFFLAFAAAALPVSGLLQNGAQSAADRYSYLSCLPFALLIGFLSARAYARRPRAAVSVCAASVLALWYLTARQASYWRDDVSLWTRAAAVEPDAYLPRSNLAQALLAAGRGAEAAPQYEAAIALEPRDAESRLNLAVIREGEGKRGEAERLYLEAIAAKPGLAGARFNLAGLYLASGRKAEGLARLREALALDPSLAARVPRGLLKP